MIFVLPSSLHQIQILFQQPSYITRQQIQPRRIITLANKVANHHHRPPRRLEFDRTRLWIQRLHVPHQRLEDPRVVERLAARSSGQIHPIEDHFQPEQKIPVIFVKINAGEERQIPVLQKIARVEIVLRDNVPEGLQDRFGRVIQRLFQTLFDRRRHRCVHSLDALPRDFHQWHALEDESVPREIRY